MRIYYTEYPMTEFKAKNDTEALELTTAKVVYRESDTPNGMPFIFLRNIKESTLENVTLINEYGIGIQG